ncbi:hypothetical protein N825_09780 [Skermanella stibiiresistens SB22]|uniref:L-threonylcarbamoyladenylate synthase n=1 Tax=Skermanella stibiiresistens SB22 TaxID=1385369 RepID=W9GVC4_9PROT|nr:L-threonylcarbamoyladenylate synthase [Skermanella stibiiresistens]EWY36601.1 hypothetical protein N825_09780 [Skermanella stibiiresistens SB22]
MTAPILQPCEESFAIAARCVADGGVVIAPSDTNLALTLDPWNDAAIARAFAIKRRPPNQALTLFVHDPEEWRDYAEVEDAGPIDRVVGRFWPGPLNIVVPRNGKVPDTIVRGGPTVAIGCIANAALRGLLAHLGRPVAMTSANLSGQADGVLVDMALALAQVGDAVDYILAGAPDGTTKSSTILDLSNATRAGGARILRHGDITAADLRVALGEVLPIHEAA